MANQSGLASLDKIGADKRVASILKDAGANRVRVELNPGWVWSFDHDRVAYFTGIKDTWAAFRHEIRTDGGPQQPTVTTIAVDADTKDNDSKDIIRTGPDAMPGLEEPEKDRGPRAIDTPVRNSKWRCPRCRRWTTDPMGKLCSTCKDQVQPTVTESEVPVDIV